MEYEPEFARSFMRRTLEIIKGYNGPYDATILVNCLLGLLVVPKESLLDKVPDDPYEELITWGIKPDSIKRLGRCNCGNEHKPTFTPIHPAPPQCSSPFQSRSGL